MLGAGRPEDPTLPERVPWIAHRGQCPSSFSTPLVSKLRLLPNRPEKSSGGACPAPSSSLSSPSPSTWSCPEARPRHRLLRRHAHGRGDRPPSFPARPRRDLLCP